MIINLPLKFLQLVRGNTPGGIIWVLLIYPTGDEIMIVGDDLVDSIPPLVNVFFFLFVALFIGITRNHNGTEYKEKQGIFYRYHGSPLG